MKFAIYYAEDRGKNQNIYANYIAFQKYLFNIY